MKTMEHEDLKVVKNFVKRPTSFLAQSSTGFSAMQTDQPFGDYAPQSSQIQGILKSMYDSFTYDLEKADATEADRQKSYLKLMETKSKELENLEKLLETAELDKATKEA